MASPCNASNGYGRNRGPIDLGLGFLTILAIAVMPLSAEAKCADLEQVLVSKGVPKNKAQEKVQACVASNIKVHELCDRGVRTCKGVTSSGEAVARASKNNQCALARKMHSNTYFGGIDSSHRQEMSRAEAARKECLDLAHRLSKK